jgi:hypothetical protein
LNAEVKFSFPFSRPTHSDCVLLVVADDFEVVKPENKLKIKATAKIALDALFFLLFG